MTAVPDAGTRPAAAPDSRPARPPGHDPRVELAARAIAPLVRALGDRRTFAIRFWDGRGIRAPGGRQPDFTLVIRRPGALRRMLLPPTDLAIGEAFVHGDFDIEGDIFAAAALPDRLSRIRLSAADAARMAFRLAQLRDTDEPPGHGRVPASLEGELHSAERDEAAIRYHYDVGNDFYRLWLDERMVYSCAYFPTDAASLDEAQLAKLDLVLDKLALRDGMRLLDIGCGWGGLLVRAAERAKVEAMGITLSERQQAYATRLIAERGLGDRVRVELMDYRSVPAALGRFDRIASIGMAEHVGRARIDDYFAAAREALAPGGLFLNHAITAQPSRRTEGGLILAGPLAGAIRTRSFIDAYVFPDGELLSLAEMLRAAQRAGFEVRDVESLRAHYARTLRHWVRRLEARWEEAVAAANEAVARTWRLYMAGAAIGFEQARLDIHQQLLVLPRDDGSSDAPATRWWGAAGD
ncbi:MAG TPA: cyclopropane-fatty-acyl-phospholipid synthase family protein [candidate division Zixibacteria bacterium]|nr:cyclopropane-fatty-acyl-phospholipid synthase family protein [candidate division Zixibacteria bacterium]